VEDKIAVHCKTKEEWDAVVEKTDKKWHPDVKIIPSKPGNCLAVGDIYLYWDSKESYQHENYKIISAQEYLNEGGKDVSEEIDQEKLCEFCRDHYDMSESWHCEGMKCEDATERYLEDNPHIKLKENNMNKNISDVFDKTKEALLVEKHLGAQIGNNFIDGLILLDKKAEVLAEAKRLEKEEKDK
jgi:hypothetical protein